MPRADLHYALVLDDEIFRASQVDSSLLDPVVRVEGLPGVSRPVAVLRDYQGPQGYYVEQFLITDAAGREVYRSPVKRVRLTGEMFEDRVVDRVAPLALTRGDDHTATFFLDGDEVGTIPVFVESGLGGDPRVAAKETFKKALQKGTVVWVTVPAVPGRRGRPAHTQAVWYVVQDDKVYVFDGPGEQQVPGLRTAETVELTARSKDVRSRVSNVEARVRVVPGDDPLFEKVGQAGLGRRLNLPDGERALERWKADCVLLELTPDFGEAAATAASATPAAAHAARPADEDDSAGKAGRAAAPDEEIHVEAQIDQEVFDRLVAEGKSERVARAKAKAAYVRAEKKRILAEQSSS